jgi:periplasmic protein TonB
MSVHRWPTLSAALFAIVVHTILLGIAASLQVSHSRESRALVSITLMQQATPLPVAENGGETPHAAPVPLPLPSPPVSKPPQRKRSPVLKPPVLRTPSPAANLARAPRLPSPPKEVRPQEDDPRLAAIVPTVPPQKSEESARSVFDESFPGSDLRMGEAQRNGAPVSGGNGSGASDGKVATGSGKSVLAQPHYGMNPKPVYPLLARRMGAQGVVLLRVRVQQDGSVAAVELVRSSGFALLDEAATRTVRDSWRFIPARLDGVAVESWVEIPIQFVLAQS